MKYFYTWYHTWMLYAEGIASTGSQTIPQMRAVHVMLTQWPSQLLMYLSCFEFMNKHCDLCIYVFWPHYVVEHPPYILSCFWKLFQLEWPKMLGKTSKVSAARSQITKLWDRTNRVSHSTCLEQCRLIDKYLYASDLAVWIQVINCNECVHKIIIHYFDLKAYFSRSLAQIPK